MKVAVSLCLILCMLFSPLGKAECDENDQRCAGEKVVPSISSSVREAQAPSSLVDAADLYAEVMVILDVMDSRVQDKEAVYDEEFSLLIRGFDYRIRPGDAFSVHMRPNDESGVLNILSALSQQGGLERLLSDLARQLNVTHLYCSRHDAAFVGWVASASILDDNLLKAASPTSSHHPPEFSLFLPLVAESTQPVMIQLLEHGKSAEQVHVKRGTALVFREDPSLLYKPLRADHDQAIFGLALGLTTTEQPPIPPLKYPILQDLEDIPLQPGEIAPVRWAHSGRIPTGGAYRLGLHDGLSDAILDHLKEIGFYERLRVLLYEKPLEAAWVNQLHTFGPEKHEWYIERPGEYDLFDMLFAVPAHEKDHEAFLRVLGTAGFDSVLDAVGRHFNWEHAAIVHISLLALSKGDHAMSHADYHDTFSLNAFNVLVPLVLVDGSEPELLVDSDDALRAQLKYTKNEAVMVGDNAFHATKSIDYREQGVYRFFAGVYIAQVTPKNKEAVIPTYYIAGYPHHDADIALRNAGKHWRRDDTSIRLPRLQNPSAAVLDEAKLSSCLLSTADKTCPSLPFQQRIIPPELVDAFSAYCGTMGILELMENVRTQEVFHFHLQGFPFRFEGNATFRFSPDSEAANSDLRKSLVGLNEMLQEFKHSLRLEDGVYLATRNVTLLTWDDVSTPEELRRTLLFDPNHLILPIVISQKVVLSSTTTSEPLLLEADRALLLSAHETTLSFPEPIQDDKRHDGGSNLVVSISVTTSSEPESIQSHTNLLQDFNTDPLPRLGIVPLRWKRSGKLPSQGCQRMHLPDSLAGGILAYLQDKLGMVDLVEQYLYKTPLDRQVRPSKKLNLNGQEWFIERPLDMDSYDMLFLVPATAESHEDFCKALAEAGFDEVLDAIGKHFDWDGIDLVHLSVLGMSYGTKDRDEFHSDYTETGMKAFNLLVPLIMGNATEPELMIKDPDDMLIGTYKYSMHEGVMVGDDCEHGTRGVDYRPGYRFYVGLYVADANEGNADMVTPDYYVNGYPFRDPSLAVKNAGRYWKRNDPTIKLPRWK